MDKNKTVEVVNDEEVRITIKRYDPESGEETEPQVDTYLKSTIETNLVELKGKIQEYEAILAHFPHPAAKAKQKAE